MLAVSPYIVVFRIVHILSAIAWAGSVFLFVTFVQPSVEAIGPAGAPFVGELLGKRRLVDVVISLGSATVIGGLFLYWHDWHLYGSFGDWIATRFGTTLTVGAVSALAALSTGIFGVRPNVKRALALGRRAAEAGGPTPEMAAEMGTIQARLKILARMSLGFIALAALAMSTARYL